MLLPGSERRPLTAGYGEIQVTAEEEKVAIIRAILELAKAIVNVRGMILTTKADDIEGLNQFFKASSDSIQEVHRQLEAMTKELSEHG